ncbi:dynein light chain Tctex-type 5-like [Saccostrea echinata]|uniref:dynein light chain Tctex-type 5-like n=1 Tax=Saccostrea echinata TaxID=191078 RepID=UPI002A82E919|nr:dynein light chain Tctex-type 5-like [Saccostrea echinata]
MLPHKQSSADGETEDDEPSFSTISRQNTSSTLPSLTGTARLRKLTKNVIKSRIDSSTISEKEVIPEVPLDKRYEPTYRMEPGPNRRFSPARSKVLIKAVLSTLLENYEYGFNSSPTPAEMAMKLPDLIIKQVKTLDLERYKLVCLVSMGSIGDSSVSICSRCLWDTNLDTSVTYTHTDKNYYCTVTLYGLYYE